MKIRLSEKQNDILINRVLINNESLLNKIKNFSKFIDDKIIINVSENEADKIRNLCCKLFDKVAFDENYSLTKEGEILEELIDLFFE